MISALPLAGAWVGMRREMAWWEVQEAAAAKEVAEVAEEVVEVAKGVAEVAAEEEPAWAGVQG